MPGPMSTVTAQQTPEETQQEKQEELEAAKKKKLLEDAEQARREAFHEWLKTNPKFSNVSFEFRFISEREPKSSNMAEELPGIFSDDPTNPARQRKTGVYESVDQPMVQIYYNAETGAVTPLHRQQVEYSLFHKMIESLRGEPSRRDKMRRAFEFINEPIITIDWPNGYKEGPPKEHWDPKFTWQMMNDLAAQGRGVKFGGALEKVLREHVSDATYKKYIKRRDDINELHYKRMAEFEKAKLTRETTKTEDLPALEGDNLAKKQAHYRTMLRTKYRPDADADTKLKALLEELKLLQDQLKNIERVKKGLQQSVDKLAAEIEEGKNLLQLEQQIKINHPKMVEKFQECKSRCDDVHLRIKMLRAEQGSIIYIDGKPLEGANKPDPKILKDVNEGIEKINEACEELKGNANNSASLAALHQKINDVPGAFGKQVRDPSPPASPRFRIP